MTKEKNVRLYEGKMGNLCNLFIYECQTKVSRHLCIRMTMCFNFGSM